jgi:hypothetical protein
MVKKRQGSFFSAGFNEFIKRCPDSKIHAGNFGILLRMVRNTNKSYRGDDYHN